jgi:surfeit locus 1 family protein
MVPPRRAWLGLLIAALVLAAAAVMIGLGAWQLARLRQRQSENLEISARLAQPPLKLTAATGDLPQHQPVQATGTYDFSQEIVLRNRAHQGQPGVHVLTPLRLADGGAVLVDRGWIPYLEADPAARAAFQSPTGPVTVSGIVRRSQSRTAAFLPADPLPSADGPRLDAWFWPDVSQIQIQTPYTLLPFYVELELASDASDAAALPIAGYELDLSEGPHLGYAIQWFAFSAILLIGSAALWRQRRRWPAGEGQN